MEEQISCLTETKTLFHYDENYFNNNLSNGWYRKYIEKVRNPFIKRQINQYRQAGNFLEIGFGHDNLLQLFSKEFEIFGADVSDYAVAKISKQFDKPENFKLCDIAQDMIPFSQKFDVICAINTIEHLANPEFAIQNIYNSMNPNGILLVQLPTQSNLFSRIQYKIFYASSEHIYRPSVKSLTERFFEVGLKKLKQCIPTFLPFQIGNQFLVESFNLYSAIFQKPEPKT